MIIDTHVHYNIEPLFSNEVDPKTWEKHWVTAQEHDVKKSIIVGTDFSTSTLGTKLAQKDKNLFASVGCHPIMYEESVIEAKTQGRSIPEALYSDIEMDMKELEVLAKLSKVVAIGETGLDYFHFSTKAEEREIVIELQKAAFEMHIQLAKKLKLPLIIHVRDKETPEEKTSGNAYWDALDILQKHKVTRFTLHCVSGPLSYVKAAIKMGGYMGFDGNITYPKAQTIRDIFAIVPEDRRLLETDAPFLPPQEFRGKTCEPWMIEETAKFIEIELKVDRDSFAHNAQQLFDLQ